MCSHIYCCSESNRSSHPASSTYDELLDALKMLEEDPEPLKQPANVSRLVCLYLCPSVSACL